MFYLIIDYYLLQLLHKRGVVCNGNEGIEWQRIPSEFMSDEEETTEDGQTVWLVRSQIWRSDELHTPYFV